MAGVDYNQGAAGYAAHRRLHGGVFRELCSKANPSPAAAVLEVGCGTGNYIRALAERFACAAFGLDPSAGMLAHARAQGGRVAWVAGRAERLGFAGQALDLVFSVDVIHHLADAEQYFREAARTLRPGGRICTVTDSESIIRSREVLSGYFPETVEIELRRYPRLAQLEAWMAAAGLQCTGTATVQEPIVITSAQPFRDKAYSSLHLISEAAWRAGLERLERDLTRGPVHGTSRYACVWGSRPAA